MKTKLGDLIVNFDRKRVPLSSRERAKRQGIYPYYGATSIMDYVDDYLFDGKYILLGEDGTVIDGKGNPILQIAEGKFWCNNHAHILQNTELVTFDYLYYLLKNTNVTSIVTGAVQPKISQTNLNSLEVDIHLDKKIQNKIASILSSIDEKIEINNAINNNLEQQAQALFKSWFVDFEPFDGKIPDVWKSGVLGDFVEIKRGGSPRPIQNYLSDSGLHWLKISDATSISSPFINEIKEYIIEEGLKKTVFLKAGNLVLSNSATPGLPKILDIDTCIHDGWLYFPSSKLSNEYLYLYFKYIRNNLVALGNGSVFTNLKTDILKNYPTNLPSADVLNEFDGIIKPIFSMILSNTRETRRLTEIRDILLPKLMSGEIDVSNIEF